MNSKLYINPPLVERAYDWKNGPQPQTRKELDKFFTSAPIRAVKRQICEMGRRIYNKGYTDGNGGNISVRVGEDLVLCTPTLCCKGFMEEKVKNFSSGMVSRLGFSIATIVEPDILILDEVLSVGDKKFKQKSENKIKSMFDQGVTVLFVSHSLPQIERICNKAILLEGGKLIAAGDVKPVVRIYKQKTGD